MDKDALKNKIRNDEVVKGFIILLAGRSETSYLKLAGGSIIDILEDRKPKDYDFCGGNSVIEKMFVDDGYKFLTDTATATTYRKGAIVVQFLKKDISEFDFTISQSCYYFKHDSLSIDETAFEKKTLIPCNWWNKDSLFSALQRVPHYYKKGYTIKDVTYLSMLNTIKPSYIRSIPSFS